jgi:deoxyribodipyrimidine photo-lyase
LYLPEAEAGDAAVSPRTAIAWFRRDLRLADNPALTHALSHAERIAPAYVTDDFASTRAADAASTRPGSGAALTPGAASRAWLARSLDAFQASLAERGAGLTRLAGPSAVALPAFAAECGASLVTCTRDWSPAGLAEETAVRESLSAAGVELYVAESQLLVTPDVVRTGGGTPYAVFTPFSRAWTMSWEPSTPLAAPARIAWAADAVDTADGGTHAESAAAGLALPLDIAAHWSPGEAGAQARLAAFSAERIAEYDRTRDLPAIEGTSELSAHLAFGELSPRQVVASVLAASSEADAWPYLRQLAWREFAYHVLHAHPDTQSMPLKPRFARFPWRDDVAGTQAWLDGRTGFPLVDAGMRQLAETGWMHNRVRLVAASFLVKDLLVPWQTGEAAFRERLVDYDPAANAFNWQWVAGSGADAAPYFRIFNPSTQAKRFDPLGEYVRRWIPELDTAEYPAPIVDHAEARTRALAALSAIGRD